MSNNNFTCRDKYYNYGSYLRSRGYDKEICNLVTDIENGNIKIGPITPGNCASNKSTTIEGNVLIKKCASNPNTGILTVNGGVVGTDTGSLIDTTYLGLQVLNGAKISGPIYQTTDCSHSNYFSAGNHVFQGGNFGTDCSTNVVINGDLSVTDDVTFNKNPVINNGSNYANRVYQNYGQSTTIIDICNNSGSGISWAEGTHDMSFNSIVYSDFSGVNLLYDVNDNIIDFSNNQDLAKDTLYEVTVYSRVKFNSNAEAISYEFKEVGTSNKVYIDTRSIQKNREYTICFGPAFFVFQAGQPDNNYLTKQFTFSMDISGNSGVVELITPPRLTIKQKSLV